MRLERFNIDHGFGQDQKLEAESRTRVVIFISLAAMLIEVVGGIIFSSMALLADGIHMASHVLAMSISYFAYRYIRKNAHNPKFSFGTGKINALAGYTGAILLLVFAFALGYESIERLIHPKEIQYNAAILVACFGLGVNLICAFIMGHKHSHSHGEAHSHSHSHEHDSNFKAIYLHILTDALTSILAIAALISAKYFNTLWMDACMGLVGTALIFIWARSLLRETTSTLLDHQVQEIDQKIRQNLSHFDGLIIQDLHSWSIGPNIYAGELTLELHQHNEPSEIKRCLNEIEELVHLTVEIHCHHCLSKE